MFLIVWVFVLRGVIRGLKKYGRILRGVGVSVFLGGAVELYSGRDIKKLVKRAMNIFSGKDVGVLRKREDIVREFILGEFGGFVGD